MLFRALRRDFPVTDGTQVRDYLSAGHPEADYV
jgi:hypothetical protein